MVFLTSFLYAHEAHMAASFLESEGIKTYIKDELTIQIYNFDCEKECRYKRRQTIYSYF